MRTCSSAPFRGRRAARSQSSRDLNFRIRDRITPRFGSGLDPGSGRAAPRAACGDSEPGSWARLRYCRRPRWLSSVSGRGPPPPRPLFASDVFPPPAASTTWVRGGSVLRPRGSRVPARPLVFGRRPRPILLIFGLQIAGGAYAAEFKRRPRRSGTFRFRLMGHDYLAAIPLANPIFGRNSTICTTRKSRSGTGLPDLHREALWWLIVSPSRGSAALFAGQRSLP